MFLGYVGAIVGGISLAAVFLIISKLFRLKFPGWVYPAAAGFGMLALTIYVEYSWFSRTASQLPEEFEVVQTFERTGVYQPWTYLVPLTDRFIAVDHSSARLNPEVENVVLVDVILMERLSPVFLASMFLDCVEGARLLVGENTQFGDDALPVGEEWVVEGTDSPLVRAVCREQGLPARG